MKNFKYLAIGALMASTVISASASAGTMHKHADNGFTSHHLVEKKSYNHHAEKLSAEDKLELREYLDYEQREQCQFYRPIPADFMKVGCDLVHKDKVAVKQKAPAEPKMAIKGVITDYEINFAFDSAKIEPAAGTTLDKVADEISKHNPREVTVSGYADKAGPADYNAKLSANRAKAVSNALNDRGVTNRVIDQKAYGENSPAVATKDGIALRENRRVVVEFRK